MPIPVRRCSLWRGSLACPCSPDWPRAPAASWSCRTEDFQAREIEDHRLDASYGCCLLNSILAKFVPQRAERDAQQSRGVRPIAVGLVERRHNQLALHLADRLSCLKTPYLRCFDTLVEQVRR